MGFETCLSIYGGKECLTQRAPETGESERALIIWACLARLGDAIGKPGARNQPEQSGESREMRERVRQLKNQPRAAPDTYESVLWELLCLALPIARWVSAKFSSSSVEPRAGRQAYFSNGLLLLIGDSRCHGEQGKILEFEYWSPK